MQVEAIDDHFTVLDNAVINANGVFRQRPIDWTVPLVFKQFTVLITGYSGDCTRIGNLYMRYEHLGYKIQEP